MSKSSAQLDHEIQEALGLPPAIVKRFRSKIAAYRKAVAQMESSYSDAARNALVKARDAIDKAIYDAAPHVPYVAGKSPYEAAPIVAMNAERDKLVRETWESAQEKGREANYRANRAEAKKLDAEIREERRPYEWLKR